jgi:AraC-like DNA-binding protein
MLSVLAPAVAACQLMMAVLIWRRTQLPGRSELAISLISGAAYFLHAAFPEALRFLLPVVLAAPLACNRAIRAGFEAPSRPLWLDLGVLVLLLGLGLAARVGAPAWTGTASSLLSLTLFLELPVIVWRGLPDDLVAARRNVRVWALGASAVLGAVVAVASVLGGARWAVPMAAALTCLLAFAAVAFGEELTDTLSATPQAKAPLDSREQQVLRRLREVIADVYSDADLTLSKLAQRLDVPEHRLRRIIHLGEGQRNFSAWLNGYRIEALKARVDEDETILNLALAVGYNSLSAFNRAFKAAEGMTPTAFRAARKANTKAMIEPMPDIPKAT